MPQKISGELLSRQLKAEVPLGRLRSSLESRAADGAFHLMKGDHSTHCLGGGRVGTLGKSFQGGARTLALADFSSAGYYLLLYRLHSKNS